MFDGGRCLTGLGRFGQGWARVDVAACRSAKTSSSTSSFATLRTSHPLLHTPDRPNLLRGQMDYSAADADSSPWASSPQAHRTTFGENVDVPSEPLPPQSPYADPAAVATEQPFADEPSLGHPSTQHHEGFQAPEGQEHPQSPQPQQHPDQYAQSPAQQSHQQQRQEPQRYHGSQRQRQNVPHYKLHAKVTALERTGRKDPILRFDVYVRLTVPLPSNILDNMILCRRTFPSSAPPNSAMSGVSTPNS